MTWYLDSYTSRYLTNDRNLFVGKIQPKTWDFTTAGGQVIWSEEVGTVRIALVEEASIQLDGVALVPECESNLISLRQLRDNRITSHDKDSSMLLMQDGVPIAEARRDLNLFVLDFVTPGKVMQTNVAIVANVAINKHAIMTIRQKRPKHLVSRSKKVRIWRIKFGHASNARIIRASKLLTGMGEFGTTYDQAKIYSDSKASEPEDVDAEPESHTTSRASRITDSGSDFDKICEPCVGSKHIRVVRRQKLMTPAEDKLEAVHVDPWGPHDPL